MLFVKIQFLQKFPNLQYSALMFTCTCWLRAKICLSHIPLACIPRRGIYTCSVPTLCSTTTTHWTCHPRGPCTPYRIFCNVNCDFEVHKQTIWSIHKFLMEFPALLITNLTVDLMHYKFQFHSNFESTVCKQTHRTWSDAVLCSVWSGTALFVSVPLKDARYEQVKVITISCANAPNEHKPRT